MNRKGREQEIVSLLLKGKTNREIGEALGIKEATVKFHLFKMFAKHSVDSRSEMILKVLRKRLAEKNITALDDIF